MRIVLSHDDEIGTACASLNSSSPVVNRDLEGEEDAACITLCSNAVLCVCTALTASCSLFSL